MIRWIVWGLVCGAAAVGCAAVDLLPIIDPPCQGREDAADCQAALEVAIPNLGDVDGFTVTVDPITCRADACSTWVNAVPDLAGDCVSSSGVELNRTVGGGWTVTSFTHGDPPCAFE